MLKAENISITYNRTLFEDITFKLGNSEKIGLVGLNGCGKSTLLKIIAGTEIPDKGTIELTKGEHLEYLPQEFDFEENLMVGIFLESLVDFDNSQMYRVKKILAKLKLGEIDEFIEVNRLSPGQRMKLYLAKLLINEPTVLLMDEPTNHLDIEGIMWLENFISEFEGICMIISHDRAFLNNSVSHIFEIDEKKLYVWEGNYDRYIEHKENFKEKREVEFKAQERKRAQLEKLLTNVSKITDGKKRGRAMEAARKRMDREVTRNEKSQYEEKKLQGLELKGHVYKTKRILEIKNLNFGYGNKKIFENANLDIYGSEKLWIFGPNGIGKSTLIKLMVSELSPESGEIKWGENLNWVYFAQEEVALPMDETVHEYFMRATGITLNGSFGVLEKYLFDKNLIKSKIRNLSPGEKSRLRFAIFSQKEYDCMLLDEPTNHLDIKTKEVIEEALRNYKGAIILVSHDRYFSENIEPDRIISIADGEIVS